MLSNVLKRKLNSLSICLITCLAIIICIGLQASLSEPVHADSSQNPLQLNISVKRRITWGQESVEYRVLLGKPRDFSIRETTIRYKMIDQQARCDATASWSQNLARNHRNIIFDWWKTKPNYLFFTKNTALKYLGTKICFKISKAASGDQSYLDGYAEIEIEKWWTDVRHNNSVCPSVYVWIEDEAMMRNGRTTLHWKIANIRHSASVRITARNHNYWFYDSSQAEPNIKKQYGNPYEVTSTHNASTDIITASRTVVGHLAPRTDNLYTVQVHRAGCPTAQDAVFMRIVD